MSVAQTEQEELYIHFCWFVLVPNSKYSISNTNSDDSLSKHYKIITVNSAVWESICAEFSVSPFHFLCFNLCFLLMVICINAESGNSILVITDSLVTHYHRKSARC